MKLIDFVMPVLICCSCGALEDGALLIDAIRVTGQNGDKVFAQDLEIEVHLYSVGPNRDTFLGCAGARTGLSRVDVSDVSFDVEAHFVGAAPTEEPLRLQDLDAPDFRFVVVEDDVRACPLEQTATSTETRDLFQQEDELIGVSPAIDRATLERGWRTGFGSVVDLSVKVHRND